MLNRLITAVFVVCLGLVFASSGLAVPSPNQEVQKSTPWRAGETPNPNGLLKAAPSPDMVPQFRKDQAAAEQLETAATPLKTPPQTQGPDTTGCLFISFWDPNTSFDFIWRVGCDRDGRRLAMRYDVPKHHTAEIYGAMPWVWANSQANDGATGALPAPDVLVEVWSDDGGVPGVLLYSEQFPASWRPTDLSNPGYEYFPFSTPVQVTGPFHISVTSVAASACDTTYFDSDDGGHSGFGGTATGTERSSIRFEGDVTWYAIRDLFGFDPNFDLYADYCFWYSLCGDIPSYVGSSWLLPIPDDPVNGYLASIGAPIPTGATWNGIGQRFVAEGPETLKTIKLPHLDPTIFFGYPHGFYDATSTNGVILSVWPDDGAGNIETSGGPLASVTVPGGLANIFPYTNADGSGGVWDTVIADFSAFNLVLIGPYHVTAEMTSDNAADGSIWIGWNHSSLDPMTGGSVNMKSAPPTDNWEMMSTNWEWLNWISGVDNAAKFTVETCRDEFYQCQNQVLYDNPPIWAWGMADPSATSGILAFAQKIKALPVNRVEKIRFMADVGGGAPGMRIYIYADGGPMGPGAPVYSQDIPAVVPGWNEVVIPGGFQILGDFYIGYEAIYPDPVNDLLVGLTEDDAHAGPHEPTNGGVWYFSGTNQIWINFLDAFGYTDNVMGEVEFCSIPVEERACAPGDDWVTIGHDFARTNASGNAVGDAQCDLTEQWYYQHASLVTSNNAPVIWNNVVIQAFTSATASEYVLLDLQTGAVLSTISSTAYSNFLGSSVRCTPTVTDLGGTPVLLIAGGSKAAVAAFDISNPAAPVELWHLAADNAWKGHVGGTTGLFNMGTVRYGTFTVVDVGADRVVYFTDDDNNVFAANLADGTPWAGFDQGLGGGYLPVTLTGNPLKSGATDGNKLYFALFSNLGGDVVALNLDGSIAWELSSGDGLQGSVVHGDTDPSAVEAFQCGVAVDAVAGELYTVSMGVGTFFGDGVVYALDAATGAIKWTAPSSQVLLSSPILDANAIYVPTVTFSIPPETGGHINAFQRTNGALLWTFTQFPGYWSGGLDQRYLAADPVLSCEPSAPDLMFIGSRGGYLSVINVQDGSEVFHRRLGRGPGFSDNQFFGGALALDAGGTAHYVVADAFGALYDLAKTGVSRARLEITNDNVSVPVEFGTPSGAVFAFENVLYNSGCADLTLTMVAKDAPSGLPNGMPGGNVRAIRSRIAEFSSSLANQLTEDAFKIEKLEMMFGGQAPEVSTDGLYDRSAVTSRNLTNRAAAAVPAYLLPLGPDGSVFDNGGQGATVTIAPGDSLDISVYVDGPAISRGPQTFWVEFTASNDPDYWLNAMAGPVPNPEVTLTLVGGCLLDTTELHFGAGEANFWPVFNTGRLAGFGVLTAQPEIEGNSNLLFGGTYFYGVSNQRIAMSSDTWTFDIGDEWISLQGDPNWCTNECKPPLMTSVALGEISLDGVTYTPITGKMVCRSFVDSVQVYGTDDYLWDWVTPPDGPAPFDNDSTIGLAVNSRVIAAVDENVSQGRLGPGNIITGILNDVVVDILEFRERNNRALTGWALGAWLDHDILGDVDMPGGLGYDTSLADFSISTAWSTDAGGVDVVAGYIKLPFGCGYDPLVNVVTTRQDQGQWEQTVLWDSAYYYLTLPPGTIYSQPDLPGSPDQASAYSFVQKDIAASEQFTIGLAYFSFDGVENTLTSDNVISDVAYLVNKWVGFGRGDVNNDNVINLADIIYLSDHINLGKPGPIPFAHLGDVNTDGAVDMADVNYLVDFYFNYGPCPMGDWMF